MTSENATLVLVLCRILSPDRIRQMRSTKSRYLHKNVISDITVVERSSHSGRHRHRGKGCCVVEQSGLLAYTKHPPNIFTTFRSAVTSALTDYFVHQSDKHIYHTITTEERRLIGSTRCLLLAFLFFHGTNKRKRSDLNLLVLFSARTGEKLIGARELF